MNIRHLKIFLTVCECGSMTLAAQKLFISQPAVSIAIHEFEDEYGVQFFDRSAKKLSLTNYGEEVYSYAKRILSLADDMNTVITERKIYSTLRIGTGIAFGKLYLPRILKRFKLSDPNSNIFITVDSSEILEPLLQNGELDLCIMEGTSHSPEFQHMELSHAPIVAVCHKDHHLARESVVTAEMLASENLLMRERRSPTREMVNAFFSSKNLTVRPTWESISALSLLNAAREKLGIAILPLDHYQVFHIPDLVVLNVEDMACVRYMDFAYRKNITLSPLAERFIQFTLDIVKDVSLFC